MSEHIVRCPSCGASWPSTHEQPTCPVCAGVDPNEGGSPGPGEDDVRPPTPSA